MAFGFDPKTLARPARARRCGGDGSINLLMEKQTEIHPAEVAAFTAKITTPAGWLAGWLPSRRRRGRPQPTKTQFQ